jgi:uncharacterized protein (UPF0335 family)
MNNTITNETKQDLKNRVEYIEKKIAEKDDILLEIREAFEAAGNTGYDVKAMKEVIKLRKRDLQKVVNEEDMRELYKDLLIEL